MTATPTPNQKTQLKRNLGQLAPLLAAHDTSAEEMLGTMLRAWSERVCPGLPHPALPYRKALLAEPAVARFVDRLASFSFLESAYWLSSAYATLCGEPYRQKLALYFTPPSLTVRLLDELTTEGADFATQVFFDPACGGAAFLAPIAVRMRDALRARGLAPQDILAHVESHLLGADLDATLCELSRHFLGMALAEEIAASGRAPAFRVACLDSLTEVEALLGTVDVVVCNPPYRKMKAAEFEALRAAYGEVGQAQPNLYALFMALAVRLLRARGLAALVTPTSFLSGRDFGQLRNFLLAHTDVLSIGMVSDRKGTFIDVEQETSLAIVRRHEGVHRAHRTRISVVASDGRYRAVGLTRLVHGGTWPVPRSENDAQILALVGASPWRLADYGFTARIGAVVWNRETRPTFFDHAQVRQAGARTAVALLWSSDIRPGGKLHFTGRNKLNEEANFVDFGSRDHSAVVRRPSVLLQRVTSNDQPRRLVGAAVLPEFIRRYGGFAGENHTVILEQTGENCPLSPQAMVAVLASHWVDRAFRCISSSTNVSVFELGQLPLPDPAILFTLLAQGMETDAAVRAAYEGNAQLRAHA